MKGKEYKNGDQKKNIFYIYPEIYCENFLVDQYHFQ